MRRALTQDGNRKTGRAQPPGEGESALREARREGALSPAPHRTGALAHGLADILAYQAGSRAAGRRTETQTTGVAECGEGDTVSRGVTRLSRSGGNATAILSKRESGSASKRRVSRRKIAVVSLENVLGQRYVLAG